MKLSAILFLLIINVFFYSCNNQETKNKEDKPTSKTTAPQEQKSEADIVFKINGKPYYKKDVKNIDLTSALQDAVLYEGALLEGKDQDPVYLKLIERYKKNILLGRYKGEIIQNYLADKKQTKEDVKKYYEDNKSRFSTLDLTKISTKDKDTSDKIYQELKNGKTPDEIKSTFENVNLIKSSDVKKYNKEFNKLEAAEFTKPISENTFYNIYVIDTVDTKEFKIIKRTAAHQLINKSKQNALKEHADNIKKEKNIKVEIIKNK